MEGMMLQIKIKAMIKKCLKKYFNLRKSSKMKIKKLVNNKHKSLNIMELTRLYILDKRKIKMKINKLGVASSQIESKILSQLTTLF